MIELHQMRARGMSIREIARQTGHDRNTVRKYLRSGEPPRMKPRPLRSSKLEPFKEHVRARMAQGLVNDIVEWTERCRGTRGTAIQAGWL